MGLSKLIKIIGLVFILCIFISFQVAEAGLGSSETGSDQDADNIPLAARYAISAAIGRDQQAYHFSENSKWVRGNNPAQSCELRFSDKGVEVGAGAGRWSLTLSGWGYGDKLNPVERATPMAMGNRVEYRRGLLTEWYVNGP